MKNKAIDLHNILFEQLERLNELTGEETGGMYHFLRMAEVS